MSGRRRHTHIIIIHERHTCMLAILANVYTSSLLLFIHTRPGGSNDTTTLTVKVLYSTLVRIRQSLLTLLHSHVSHTFKSASSPARSSVDESSSLTPQRRPTSTHHEQLSFTASLRSQNKRHKIHDSQCYSDSECADNAPCHTVEKLHCLGRRRNVALQRTVHVMLRNAGAVL